ncbi:MULTISPECIES: methyltetrahydrofolate cobalamin methyltransferase [unclassified Candidatus Frackibacter]|uniref:methyltetrahydrofolate cobalamin methyltransferase n=1 Tax=unclassified Candidatus Frackibacter TaxID=2648818 RepID=UPI000797F7FB|nr:MULTISPECIES: methyltetrahydrofolate cobalamin methyltransferase [unclassified Candidatus Frackibacter]KXS41068.1 MAG: 5-methyltetrahydrofolate--homocysteine methyltransferase [Candidatus Frackibacter sp. T328-2]SDC12816.1 5-methyltetrahydrofolate--homocysteine methyltransferase [Candidatus Frackibacter sp. WG11]SEM35650.1 5-methyltetrahydrofolate--homocysteine methyltransferase [Candidatus Frackibacter sp. WG12]SFL40788.1 5-methyltetrahydrofolate--homocysteine methyltransferase [Candidatus 
MIVIGELINTSREEVEPAVKERDVEFIQNLAKEQEEAGADFIDVNCGTLIKEEPEALEWLVNTVQEVVDVPLCIDSPNPEALERGLAAHEGKALVNSITAEGDRYDEILPMLKEHDAAVVALAMDDSGMPNNADDRVRVASKLIDDLTADGIALDDIYVDPIIQPIGTDGEMGLHILNAIEEIATKYEGVHITCGLSNISHGLPKRQLLNQAYVVLAMSRGLDSAIMDPLDDKIMSLAIASDTLLGNDQYCANYIKAAKSERLTI